MSRFIDSEKFDCVAFKGIPEGYKDTFADGILYVLNRIDEESTADAVEVKHGHWIKGEKIYPDMLNDSTYTYLCSKCHHSDVHGDNVEVPYCWKCGAKMDEVTK